MKMGMHVMFMILLSRTTSLTARLADVLLHPQIKNEDEGSQIDIVTPQILSRGHFLFSGATLSFQFDNDLYYDPHIIKLFDT